MRFGNTNNIITRVGLLLDYDFSESNYMELVYQVTFSDCDSNTETDMLDFSYWYKDLHDALTLFESKNSSEVPERRKLIKSINTKLIEVHTALVTQFPDEWPEYKHLIPKKTEIKVVNSPRRPEPSAQALFNELKKLFEKNTQLSIDDVWKKIEKANGIVFEQLEDKFSKVSDQKLRMKSIREQLLFGCIEVTNLTKENDNKKSSADFRYIFEDGGLEKACKLRRSTVAKRLNEIKKDFTEF